MEHDQLDYLNSEDFYQQMSKRRTIRSFSSRSVDRRILYNAIRTAAEVVEKEFYSSRASDQWRNDLKPFGTNSSKPYLSEAPALICVFSRTNIETPHADLLRTYYPIESTGIAVGFLLTALHNAELATLTHTPKPMLVLNKVLNLDKTYKPFMIVVAGYRKYPVLLPDIKRKPLKEIMSEY